jgi:hypothetical protein
MVTRIGSELRRTGLETQIKAAIKEAILIEEINAYYFNEARSVATTTAQQGRYPMPTDFQAMRVLSMDINGNGNYFPLEAITYTEYEETYEFGSFYGISSQYALFAERICLGPIPNGEYTLRLSYNKSLGALSADGDSNAWMLDGEPLIRHRAKAILLRNVILGDAAANQATVQDGEAERAHTRLKMETQKRTATGKIRGWRFFSRRR